MRGGGGSLRRSRLLALRFLAATLAAALIVAGCGDDDAATTTTTTTTTPGEKGPSLTQSCTHQERDVRIVVRYPEGWHANDGGGVVACTAFDPDPIDLRPATEFPLDLAVVLRVEPVAFERASSAAGRRVENERRMITDGRRAIRQEAVSTGSALLPEGLRMVRYVIDGGVERSIIATTNDVDRNDFPASVQVLDAMVSAFDIDPRKA